MPFKKGHVHVHVPYARQHAKVTEQEQAFLLAYYDEESLTKGNAAESARVAGYAEQVALTQATRVLHKYDKKKFRFALEAAGVNNILMAWRLRTMILSGADKDAINAIRLALGAKGEVVDGQQAQGNVFNAPVMIIMGMTKGRLEALKGAVPQLSEEMQQELDERASAARLEDFKAGKLGFISRHSEATTGYTGWNANDKKTALRDQHADDGQPSPEVEPPAG